MVSGGGRDEPVCGELELAGRERERRGDGLRVRRGVFGSFGWSLCPLRWPGGGLSMSSWYVRSERWAMPVMPAGLVVSGEERDRSLRGKHDLT